MEGYHGWEKADGTPCTKLEVLRMYVMWRRRNREMAKLFSPDVWLDLM